MVTYIQKKNIFPIRNIDNYTSHYHFGIKVRAIVECIYNKIIIDKYVLIKIFQFPIQVFLLNSELKVTLIKNP